MMNDFSELSSTGSNSNQGEETKSNAITDDSNIQNLKEEYPTLNEEVTKHETEMPASENCCVENDGHIIKEENHNDNADVKLEDSNPLLEQNKKLSEAVVIIQKPLCANYRSDSDTDSMDSDSDSSASKSSSSSSSSSTDTSSDEESNENLKKNESKKKGKCPLSNGDLLLNDLPPIEELKISLPEQSCKEIGTITSIVESLVIVESYKGTAPLDVDTVLFLECGKKPLGKIFEILGPISEPIYAVRFNTSEEIVTNKIVKGLKVYYAPETQHTSFVLLSDVLKFRGSDASWKDNIEAPPEFQDFSDDEEEKKFKNKNNVLMNGRSSNNVPGSRKRTFNSTNTNKQFFSNRQNSNESNEGVVFRSPLFSPRYRFRPQQPDNSFAPAGMRPPWPRCYQNRYPVYFDNSNTHSNFFPIPQAYQSPGYPLGNPPNFQSQQSAVHGIRPGFSQAPENYSGTLRNSWAGVNNVLLPPPPPPPAPQ